MADIVAVMNKKPHASLIKKKKSYLEKISNCYFKFVL